MCHDLTLDVDSLLLEASGGMERETGLTRLAAAGFGRDNSDAPFLSDFPFKSNARYISDSGLDAIFGPSLNACACARGHYVVKSSPGCHKTKLQKRRLTGTFHQLKQAAEALHSKLRDQFLLHVPLLQITKHVWPLNFRTEFHSATAARQPRRQHYRLQGLCDFTVSSGRSDQPQKELNHRRVKCS